MFPNSIYSYLNLDCVVDMGEAFADLKSILFVVTELQMAAVLAPF